VDHFWKYSALGLHTIHAHSDAFNQTNEGESRELIKPQNPWEFFMFKRTPEIILANWQFTGTKTL